MKETRYSESFKQDILSKVKNRGKQSLPDFAVEYGVNRYTLKNWLQAEKQSQHQHEALNHTPLPVGLQADQWSAAQRLMALNQTHALDQVARSAWCRTHGLFDHHLQTWTEEFSNPKANTTHKEELRALQTKYLESQSELRRKEKALVEAAALLVLQKKFRALLEDQDK
jgi:transposase-like protein